ncbi:MAG: AMP-binding protein [Verrucomicrobiota bacterium]
MPYPRWLETARRFASQPAIFDGDRTLTFAELAAAVARAPIAEAPVVARTGSCEFFVEILRAWRDGQAVIPLERDAAEPILKISPPFGTALVKYTPGASGIPRGIFLNGDQVIADGDRITAAMGLVPSVPNLGVVSLAHSYGFSNVVLPLVLHGVPVHLATVPFPRVIEEIFRSHASLVVPAVPSMWRAWHRSEILSGAPIALAISAGAPLALSLEADVFVASGIKIRNFYGASECGGISFDTSEKLRESADDVGTALPGVDVSLSSAGRILVRSSSVAMGYDAPRADDQLGDGCYLTRDLGNIDGFGKIHLTGTLGGAINVAGRKVSPAKVEAAISDTGLVRRIHVHGIPSNDPERFEEIAAEVELENGSSLADLKTAVSARLPSWEIPRHWTCG